MESNLPSKPRKPASVFFKFRGIKSEQLKKDNPDKSGKEIMRMVSDMYQKAAKKPDKEFKKLEKEYQKEKKAYDKELEKYRSDNADQIEEEKKMLKRMYSK